MGSSRRAAVFGFALAIVFGIGLRSAWAAPVYMPPGSTVWMKFQTSAVPGTASDDVVGSNLAGLAPPNGIPFTTVSDGVSTGTGYAEILPTRVRTFLSSTTAGRMRASFQDTYTVGGTAAGPFDVTFHLDVSGTMRSVPAGPFHQLLGASIDAEIGTFNPASDGGGFPLLEQFRVTPFPDQSSAGSSYIHTPTDSRSTPFSFPVSTTASYTKSSVNVGDVITIAYGVNSAFSKGEIDLLNTGAISFALPDGVTLSSAMAQALPPPGSIRIVGNDGVNDGITVVNIAAGTTATGSIEVTENPLVETINIGNGVTTGNLIITDNDGATTINIADGASTGELVISGNDGATTINMADGASTGDLTITENDAATVINIAEGTVTGDLTITDNGNATVNLAANTTVAGDLTLETTGSGLLDLGGAGVSGNLDLAAEGYTTVEANTAAGQTAVTMINSEATMEVVLPTGTFPAGAPVPFSVEKLMSGAVETVGDDTVTHLQSYRFNFDTPSLDQDATLNFEINLPAMDDASRQSLLDLLHADALLTLAVRGDDPDAPLQLFDVCAPGTDPLADVCVRVLWLDENGLVLDQMGVIDPTVIRFEGLVGHFSTYSIVAFTPVPEPASLMVLALGAWTLRRRRR